MVIFVGKRYLDYCMAWSQPSFTIDTIAVVNRDGIENKSLDSSSRKQSYYGDNELQIWSKTWAVDQGFTDTAVGQ